MHAHVCVYARNESANLAPCQQNLNFSFDERNRLVLAIETFRVFLVNIEVEMKRKVRKLCVEENIETNDRTINDP